MKKYIITISVILLSVSLSNAQGVTDVVRHGNENLQGTARFQALSGAFGALGGDLSSIAINPAGSAVFNSSKTTFTSTASLFDNTASYFGSEESVNDYNIDMNQIGGVFVFDIGNENSKLKKITLGLNYDRVNNYQNELYVLGQSNTSIDQYFLSYANGRRFGDIIPLVGESVPEAYINIGTELGFPHQQAFLGYQIGIIDAVDDSNLDEVNYNSRVGPIGSLTHEYAMLSEGNSSKFTVNLASQVGDFYFGASGNFHSVRYSRLTQFNETGYDPAASPMNFMYFDNLLTTNGNGFSFTAGAIGKIKDMFRVGVTYQSPVWYTLTDELSQAINSNLAFPAVASIDFSIINVFPEYKIQTPAKYTGSIAAIFGKKGLISFDYDYQDFSTAKFKPEDDPFLSAQNEVINTDLKAVSTFRIGGEYRLGGLSLRGGYRLQDSPYANDTDLGDLQGYSFGLGYNFGSSQIDVSYNQFTRSENHALFDGNEGFTNAAAVDSKYQNITLSLSVNL